MAQSKNPQARKGSLVVKELNNEVLVYDLDRDKAHCLNQTAALIWKYCDGRNDVAHIANMVGKELHTHIDEKVVWFALSQLSKDRLLQEEIVTPEFLNGMSRRDMIRALGLAAIVAVPVVTSIVAPTPAQAATCVPSGGGCSASAQCCSGLCNIPPGTCA